MGKKRRKIECTFTIDPTKSPKWIDTTRISDHVRWSGIYELDGDTLKLFLGSPGGKRPTEFKTKAGTQQVIHTHERIQPGKDAQQPAPEAQPEGQADEIADVPSQELVVGKDKHKRYFLIGPAKKGKRPRPGYGLLLVLPGGPGTANFHPFVKRIYQNAVPDGYLVAQLVAVKWTDDQEIVWPTAKVAVDGMAFTTEKFIDAVIDDVAARHTLDKARVFTLSWSSSGPAAYAASLTSKKVTGSFVAMSVFNPKYLPDLKNSRGHGYYLYHSPEDRVCPCRMAQEAAKQLQASGAKVKLALYADGHGWHGRFYEDIRQGIRWLEKQATAGGK